MKKLALIILAIVCFGTTLFAQVPDAFKYQAVLRNSDGEIISGQEVSLKISILTESSTGDIVYSEEHSAATNDLGIVSLNIGGGTVLSGNFQSIAWGEGDKFLKIEMDESGGSSFSELGTFQLLSVPYALYANSAAKLGDNAVYSTSTDTLFVVKDHEGNIVFAVYPDGAEVITNKTAKGSIGGFAVSGRTSTKTDGIDILRVTPDSTRIYINESVTKRSIGGFAVSGRTSTKNETSSWLNITKNNYFIGHESGQNLSSGLYNSSLGYQTGYSISEGNSNAFIGYQTGYNNSTGSGNLFLGYQTGYSNQYGNYNSFLGYLAGFSNTTGIYNTFLGSFSGFSNTEGRNNTFVGDSTGYYNLTGYENTFIGTGCGKNNNTGLSNVFNGNKSGFSNTGGSTNVFIGNRSGYYALNGVHNVFIGDSSGFRSTNTWGNVNIGFLSGHNTTTGSANVFVGAKTGYLNTTGFSNVFIGIEAGYMFDGDYGNTFIGDHSGFKVLKSHRNVLLGAYAGYNSSNSDEESHSNVIIGNAAGYNSIAGNSNVFIGFESGYSNTESFSNVFIGNNAGYNNITGNDNVYMGFRSGYENQTGRENVFLGWLAGEKCTSGYNTFLGSGTGVNFETGEMNVFVGLKAGSTTTSGTGNTIIGAWAASEDTIGYNNVFVGGASGRNSNGNSNVMIGHGAGHNNKGNKNILIGEWAGANDINGSNKLYIENSDKDSLSALIWGDFENDLLRFNGSVSVNGHPIPCTDLSINKSGNGGVFAINGTGNEWYYSQIKLMSQEEEINKYWELNHRIGNAFNIIFYDGIDSWKEYLSIDTVGSITLGDQASSPILLDVNGNARFQSIGSGDWGHDLNITSDGTLTTSTSDKRLKTNIQPIESSLDKVLNLNGYTFTWKSENDTKKDAGLIAQEVIDIFPEAVFINPYDGYYGINYSRFPALFVEAFKEQNCKIEEQQEIIQTQKEKILDLEKRLSQLEEILLNN
ncbi:MAG: tail fiber domain-containing protein [Thiohalospira sp.]